MHRTFRCGLDTWAFHQLYHTKWLTLWSPWEHVWPPPSFGEMNMTLMPFVTSPPLLPLSSRGSHSAGGETVSPPRRPCWRCCCWRKRRRPNFRLHVASPPSFLTARCGSGGWRGSRNSKVNYRAGYHAVDYLLLTIRSFWWPRRGSTPATVSANKLLKCCQ